MIWNGLYMRFYIGSNPTTSTENPLSNSFRKRIFIIFAADSGECAVFVRRFEKGTRCESGTVPATVSSADEARHSDAITGKAGEKAPDYGTSQETCLDQVKPCQCPGSGAARNGKICQPSCSPPCCTPGRRQRSLRRAYSPMRTPTRWLSPL